MDERVNLLSSALNDLYNGLSNIDNVNEYIVSLRGGGIFSNEYIKKIYPKLDLIMRIKARMLSDIRTYRNKSVKSYLDDYYKCDDYNEKAIILLNLERTIGIGNLNICQFDEDKHFNLKEKETLSIDDEEIYFFLNKMKSQRLEYIYSISSYLSDGRFSSSPDVVVKMKNRLNNMNNQIINTYASIIKIVEYYLELIMANNKNKNNMTFEFLSFSGNHNDITNINITNSYQNTEQILEVLKQKYNMDEKEVIKKVVKDFPDGDISTIEELIPLIYKYPNVLSFNYFLSEDIIKYCGYTGVTFYSDTEHNDFAKLCVNHVYLLKQSEKNPNDQEIKNAILEIEKKLSTILGYTIFYGEGLKEQEKLMNNVSIFGSDSDYQYYLWNNIPSLDLIRTEGYKYSYMEAIYAMGKTLPKAQMFYMVYEFLSNDEYKSYRKESYNSFGEALQDMVNYLQEKRLVIGGEIKIPEDSDLAINISTSLRKTGMNDQLDYYLTMDIEDILKYVANSYGIKPNIDLSMYGITEIQYNSYLNYENTLIVKEQITSQQMIDLIRNECMNTENQIFKNIYNALEIYVLMNDEKKYYDIETLINEFYHDSTFFKEKNFDIIENYADKNNLFVEKNDNGNIVKSYLPKSVEDFKNILIYLYANQIDGLSVRDNLEAIKYVSSQTNDHNTFALAVDYLYQLDYDDFIESYRYRMPDDFNVEQILASVPQHVESYQDLTNSSNWLAVVNSPDFNLVNAAGELYYINSFGELDFFTPYDGVQNLGNKAAEAFYMNIIMTDEEKAIYHYLYNYSQTDEYQKLSEEDKRYKYNPFYYLSELRAKKSKEYALVSCLNDTLMYTEGFEVDGEIISIHEYAKEYCGIEIEKINWGQSKFSTSEFLKKYLFVYMMASVKGHTLKYEFSNLQMFVDSTDRGFDSASSGFYNLFFADGKKSESDFYNMYLDYAISNSDQSTQWVNKIGTSIGNMAPSMIIGMATSPVGGAIAMGISTAGNKREEMLQAGYTSQTAMLTALAVGASEATLGYFLGKIPGLSKIDDCLPWIGKVASEASEEALQSIIEPLLVAAISGEKVEISWQEVAESAILGGLIGGMFNVGQLGADIKLVGSTLHGDITLTELQEIYAPKVNPNDSKDIQVSKKLQNAINESFAKLAEGDVEAAAKIMEDAGYVEQANGIRNRFSNMDSEINQSFLNDNVDGFKKAEEIELLDDIDSTDYINMEDNVLDLVNNNYFDINKLSDSEIKNVVQSMNNEQLEIIFKSNLEADVYINLVNSLNSNQLIWSINNGYISGIPSEIDIGLNLYGFSKKISTTDLINIFQSPIALDFISSLSLEEIAGLKQLANTMDFFGYHFFFDTQKQLILNKIQNDPDIQYNMKIIDFVMQNRDYSFEATKLEKLLESTYTNYKNSNPNYNENECLAFTITAIINYQYNQTLQDMQIKDLCVLLNYLISNNISPKAGLNFITNVLKDIEKKKVVSKDIISLSNDVSFTLGFDQKLSVDRQIVEQTILKYFSIMPIELQKSIDNIEVFDGSAHSDLYWSIQYENFKGAAALGGDGNMYFYGGIKNIEYAIYHEAGHNLDYKLAKLLGFSSDNKISESNFRFDCGLTYKEAVEQDGGSITDYAKNAICEDFADSIKKFIKEPQEFSEKYKNRYKIFEEIFGLGKYQEQPTELRKFIINNLC